MKIAIIGSKKIKYSDFEKNLPPNATEIIWSGDNEIILEYANKNKIKLTLFPPDTAYGKAANFIRVMDVIQAADLILAFWDGEDMYTKAMIEYCKNTNKNVEPIII